MKSANPNQDADFEETRNGLVADIVQVRFQTILMVEKQILIGLVSRNLGIWLRM
jgi:hypothetical protein